MTFLTVFLFAMITTDTALSEQTLFARYDDLAFRPDSTTLFIITVIGDTMIFSNSSNPEYVQNYFDRLAQSVLYRLTARLPEQNYWVVQRTGYEWGEWLLLNGENGRIDTTLSAPVTSPDGNRLLCAMEDIESGFLDNGIQIWRIDPDSLSLEFQCLPVSWGPINAEWENDSSIVFEKLKYSCDTGEYTTRPGGLMLTGDGIWIPNDFADLE